MSKYITIISIKYSDAVLASEIARVESVRTEVCDDTDLEKRIAAITQTLRDFAENYIGDESANEIVSVPEITDFSVEEWTLTAERIGEHMRAVLVGDGKGFEWQITVSNINPLRRLIRPLYFYGDDLTEDVQAQIDAITVKQSAPSPDESPCYRVELSELFFDTDDEDDIDLADFEQGDSVTVFVKLPVHCAEMGKCELEQSNELREAIDRELERATDLAIDCYHIDAVSRVVSTTPRVEF